MSFLGFEGKHYLIFGLANKKSVAHHIARIVEDEGGRLILSVQDEAKAEAARKLHPEALVRVCDVTDDAALRDLAASVARERGPLNGLIHSVAYAPYSGGQRPFHQTPRADFLRALDVSCFSLIAIAAAFQDALDRRASVVTISISTTRMAAENYGYMAPIKAALDAALPFLAKSFAAFSEVRFNAVAPGLLKTSASAGIPGYADAWLYAERIIPRRRGLDTAEAARAAAFLLSEASSGINARKLVVDAGMAINYFDAEIVRRALAD